MNGSDNKFLAKNSTEKNVQDFYNQTGWHSQNANGPTKDAELFEDLRACAADYIKACRLKLLRYIPASGANLLDAASGPIQYPEYLLYSQNFTKRYCVDISEKALQLAQEKLKSHGEYFCTSMLALPFKDDFFDCSISLHTIYHIEAQQQAQAVRELIRVTKPQQPIIILYSNPDKLLSWLKKRFSLGRSNPNPPQGVLYFHPHPLVWWQQFSDQCSVEIYCWRFFTVHDAQRLIPDNFWGRMLLKLTLVLEDWLRPLSVRFGAYPVIVLTKRH